MVRTKDFRYRKKLAVSRNVHIGNFDDFSTVLMKSLGKKELTLICFEMVMPDMRSNWVKKLAGRIPVECTVF
jgi:hypothetical protein